MEDIFADALEPWQVWKPAARVADGLMEDLLKRFRPDGVRAAPGLA